MERRGELDCLYCYCPRAAARQPVVESPLPLHSFDPVPSLTLVLRDPSPFSVKTDASWR